LGCQGGVDEPEVADGERGGSEAGSEAEAVGGEVAAGEDVHGRMKDKDEG
jgi:hypothetical protein